MQKKDGDRYFRTTSFPMTVFLFAKDFQIAGIDPTGDGDQQEFTFVKTPTLEELTNLYRFGSKDDEQLLVPVHKYEQARNELLSALKDKRF